MLGSIDGDEQHQQQQPQEVHHQQGPVCSRQEQQRCQAQDPQQHVMQHPSVDEDSKELQLAWFEVVDVASNGACMFEVVVVYSTL